MITNMIKIPAPALASQDPVRKAISPRRRFGPGVASGGASTAATVSAAPQPWVECDYGEIGKQIEDHEAKPDHQCDDLHYRDVL
jgi:hypothetical protein